MPERSDMSTADTISHSADMTPDLLEESATSAAAHTSHPIDTASKAFDTSAAPTSNMLHESATSSAANLNLSNDTASESPKDSAVDRVFNLPELLENILLKLPMKDLLLDQRTCKTWKATIDTSKRLQRKLFFLPELGEPIKLIKSPYGPGFTYAMYLHDATEKPIPIYRNPVLGYLNDLCDRQLNLGLPNFITERHTGRDASWRRMLICQPSVQTRLRADVEDFSGAYQKAFFMDIDDSRETKLGRLVDAVVSGTRYDGTHTEAKGYMGHIFRFPTDPVWDTVDWDGS